MSISNYVNKRVSVWYLLLFQERSDFIPLHVSQLFYLIHSMGTFNIPTHSGKRWFITFIDDHPGLCWIYLINTKAKVERHFKKNLRRLKINFALKSIFWVVTMKLNFLTNILKIFWLKMVFNINSHLGISHNKMV